MPLTSAQLQHIFPDARCQAGVFISALNTAMAHRQINTPKRKLPSSRKSAMNRGSCSTCVNWAATNT